MQDGMQIGGTERERPRGKAGWVKVWEWRWFCPSCGVESVATTEERAREWAEAHRCGGGSR